MHARISISVFCLLLFACPAVAQDQKSNEIPELSLDGPFEIDFMQLPVEDADEEMDPELELIPDIEVQEATVEPDDTDLPEAMQKVKVRLFTLSNVPEFKTKVTRQCKTIKIGGFKKKICTNLPQMFTRMSKITAFVEVSHPSANSIRGDIERSVREAVAAGAITIVGTSGNVAAAAAALKIYLKGALAGRLGNRVSQLGVTVRTETERGSWKPR